MPNLTTHHTDLRAIADAYKEQREAGALYHTAFIAAIITYCQRHPDVARSEAALIVNQLVGDYPLEWETLH